MKLLSALVIFGAGILWWLFPNHPQENISQSAQTNPSLVQQQASPQLAAPPLLKQTQSQTTVVSDTPPDSVQDYVKKSIADPQYDWKQPINFYGRVVDESNVPVAAASVHFTWNDISEKGTSDADAKSDGNGFFSLKDRHGKRLYVDVGKEGYYSSGNSRGAAFEYANPADGLFKPDQNNPVVFYLRKKGQGEKLIQGLKLFGSRIEGTPSYVDLTEGKNSLTPPGDFTVQCTRSERNADRKFDWTFTLGAVGGGLVESTDEFMFLAPEDGYQPTFEIGHKASDSDWVGQEKHKLFIKSQDGKHYARIEITIMPGYSDKAAYDLKWTLNPNGSRNLESK